MTSFLMDEPPNSKAGRDLALETAGGVVDHCRRSRFSYWRVPSGLQSGAIRPVPVRSPRVLHVLLVDADPVTNALLRQLATRWGHAAHEVQGAIAAMRIAEAMPPNLVLINMGLPVTLGLQLSRRLWSDPTTQDCLIIAITSRDDRRRRQQCIESGIDLLLPAPLNSSVVETLLLLECMRNGRLHQHHAQSAYPYAREKTIGSTR